MSFSIDLQPAQSTSAGKNGKYAKPTAAQIAAELERVQSRIQEMHRFRHQIAKKALRARKVSALCKTIDFPIFQDSRISRNS
jgi:hypothetical protein